MANQYLEIVRDSDESIEFFIDGIKIASVNHDQHGWVGMEAVEEALVAMADVVGIGVEEIEADNN